MALDGIVTKAEIINNRKVVFDPEAVKTDLKTAMTNNVTDTQFISDIENQYGFSSRKIEVKGDAFIVYGKTENGNGVQLEFDGFQTHGTIRKLGEAFANIITNRGINNSREYNITHEAIYKAGLATKIFQKYDIHLVKK